MNYTLNQLPIFRKVTQKESVTKASEELYLSQPAVSIQLKKISLIYREMSSGTSFIMEK